MMQLRINGEIVPLPRGFRLEQEWNNPLFDSETIRGMRIFDMNIAHNPQTERLLGYPADPRVLFDDRRYLIELYADTNRLMRGYMKLTEASERIGYRAYAVDNLGEVFGNYQTSLINRMPFGDVPLLSSPSANHATDAYAMPSIVNPDFFGSVSPPGFEGIVNHYTGGAYNPNAPRVAMPFLRHVLNRIGELCDLTLSGPFFEDTDLARLIIYNTVGLDGQTSVTIERHLPEISLVAFLMELRKLLNLSYQFDPIERSLRIGFLGDVFGQECERDWTTKTDPKPLRTPQRSNRLRLSWSLDTNDALMKAPLPTGFDDYFTPITEANANGSQFDIVSAWSSLPTDTTTGFAAARQQGATTYFGQTDRKFTPRLLFWNGVVSGNPVATNAQGAYRLAWSGSNNLRDTRYAAYEAWRGRTFQVSQFITLNASDLAWIMANPGKKVHIKGVNYFVNRIVIPHPIGDPCKVELLAA